MQQAENSGHLIHEFSTDGVPFPEEKIKGDGPPVLTLTVWKNLESLRRFTYSERHLQALRDRSKWVRVLSRKTSFLCSLVGRECERRILGRGFQTVRLLY